MHVNGAFYSRKHSEKDNMRVAIIKYGHRKVSTKKAIAWGKKVGDSNPLVINNLNSGIMPGETEGDNSFYEFSAYRLACRQLVGEGPFLIVNDTLFHNHLAGAWLHMLRRIKVSGPAVVGDIRTENTSFPEKGKFFLASWLFYLPDRNSLTMFSTSLDTAFKSASKPASTDYNQYVDHWLRGKKWMGGWHGTLSHEAYERKKLVIRLEHALSLELEKHQLIKGIGLFCREYSFVRLAERLYTRLLGLMKHPSDSR